MLTTYKTVLKRKTQLTEDVYLFNFKLVDPPEINFSAGQYLILNVPQSPGEPVKRLYSVASPETEKNSLEFIVQLVPNGLASIHLNNLKVGDEEVFEGPAGAFVLRKNENSKVFLATGTGIAPIRSIIISNLKSQISLLRASFAEVATKAEQSFGGQANPYPKTQNQYYLFWGLRYYKDVYLFDEFKNLTKEQKNFQFKICLSREESLNMIPEQDKKYFSFGHVDKEINNLCSTFNVQRSTPNQNKFGSGQVLKDMDFYICGGRDVVESLKHCLVEKEAFQGNIYFEKY